MCCDAVPQLNALLAGIFIGRKRWFQRQHAAGRGRLAVITFTVSTSKSAAPFHGDSSLLRCRKRPGGVRAFLDKQIRFTSEEVDSKEDEPMYGLESEVDNKFEDVDNNDSGDSDSDVQMVPAKSTTAAAARRARRSSERKRVSKPAEKPSAKPSKPKVSKVSKPPPKPAEPANPGKPDKPAADAADSKDATKMDESEDGQSSTASSSSSSSDRKSVV